MDRQSMVEVLQYNKSTYIPANARGLVNSNTRCPASSPSPSTEITTKSSAEMVPVVGENSAEYL